MRAFSSAMVLSLATASVWLGWPIAQAQAQMPGMYPPSYGQPMMMGPGAYMPQGQVAPVAYMSQGMAPGACMGPGGACMAPDACMGPGACMPQGQCSSPMGDCGIPCRPDRCSPLISFMGEAIGLQRSTTRSQTLVQNDNGGDLLNSKNMNFPVAFGPKMSATLHNPCDIGWDLEVAYFQVDGFAATGSVPGTTLFVSDATTPHSPHVTDAEVRYASQLYNGELNIRQQWCDWLTLLCGYRMVELTEQYNANGTGVEVVLPVTISNHTSNHLHGFQIGADAEFYNMGGPLTISALCKAGVFQNYTSQTMSRTWTSTESVGNVRDHAAFLGEVGIVARYALTQRFALRASYEAMWLEGVALAPEQIGATNFRSGTTVVDVSGGVFYHGGGLGCEYRF